MDKVPRDFFITFNPPGKALSGDRRRNCFQVPGRSKLKGKRDYVILALLVGCALQANLCVEDIQMREGRWVIADLRGKGGRVRTVAVPVWVKQGINAWTTAAESKIAILLRSISKSGKLNGEALSDWGHLVSGRSNCHGNQESSALVLTICGAPARNLSAKLAAISSKSSSSLGTPRSRRPKVIFVRNRNSPSQ